MILDLIVTKADDGYDAKIPSLNEAESWAHSEDEAIEKVIELLMFYLGLEEKKKIKIDLARRENNQTIYKLVFNKP